jgi:predicted dienelactone hydrolase
MNRVKYLVLIIFSVAILILVSIDFAGGNYRWQMLPAIISSLVILISSLVLWSLKIRSPLLFPILVGLGVIGLLASAVFSYLYPIFTFPVPTGRYRVGTTSIDLVDKSRLELCDPSTKSNRELVVQIWYPTTSNNGTKAPYLHDKRLIPKGVFSHLNLIKTNAVRDAPIATVNSPYSIVLYTPSWSGFRTDNTFQTEELASQGFVVIGLEHPCSVPIAIYPSGRAIYSNLSSDYTSSDAALATLLRVGEEQVILRTQDIQFVLNQLPQINDRALFKGTLNLNKIGIFGHSFGGATAAQACSIDLRLKAGISMDGLLFGSAAQQGAVQPFLFMQSDYARPTPAELNSTDGKLRRTRQTDAWGYQQRDRWFKNHGGYDLKLLKSEHLNFSDYPLRSRRDNGGGKISPERAMKIINTYTVAFFDRELNGKPSSLLLNPQSGSPFPEVIFEHHVPH